MEVLEGTWKNAVETGHHTLWETYIMHMLTVITLHLVVYVVYLFVYIC
jgi:hypothetical protein